MLELLNCRLCGGNLSSEDGKTYRCGHCGKVFVKSSEDDYVSALKSVIEEAKWERVSAARRNLWKAMHEEYVDSSACVSYARELKSLIPEDYFANFAEVVNTRNDADITKFLNESTEDDTEVYADAVLDFMLKSMTPGTLTAVSAYIDRAYGTVSPEYIKYINLYEKEAEKVDSGIYELTLHRDVFLAYSSADTEEVVRLCEYLESQKISCFLSMRNLRHGKGAADNYDEALKTAMDGCAVVVFISSRNSRNLKCDALKKELPYMRARDVENAPSEYKNLSYDKIPSVYKKPRVEYLLDEYRGTTADTIAKQIFDGYEWCKTPEDVAVRVAKLITAVPKAAGKDKTKTEGKGDAKTSAEGSASVPLDVKEKNVLEHMERLLDIGSFEDALKGLTELEREEIAVRGKASAAVYYYKILAKNGAKSFKDVVKFLTLDGNSLSKDKDYLLSRSSDDDPYKSKIEDMASRIDEINRQENAAAENERRQKELARAREEERVRRLEEDTLARERRSIRSLSVSLTLVVVILAVLCVMGLAFGYSGYGSTGTIFSIISGVGALLTFIFVAVLNTNRPGSSLSSSRIKRTYDSVSVGMKRFWLYALVIVFALSFFLGIFFMI